MKSNQLFDATSELRHTVEVLGRLAEAQHDALSGGAATDLNQLVKEVRRRAREVDAWGNQLKSPCALTAAQEAYQLLAKLGRSSEIENAAHFAKTGAIVCLQVQHDTALDCNEIAQDLKHAVFNSISEDPPLRPLKFSVGLLPMEEHSFAAWARLTSQCAIHRTTLAPLNVTFLAARTALSAMDLSAYFDSATGGDRLRLNWCGRIAGVVIPLERRAVGPVERRCVGPLLNGEIKAESQ
jgi:hypothetical protein